MMKTTGRVTSCCAALFLALTSVSAVQRLNSINDLKRINFGQSVPKHSLVLLHWFANTVDITSTDVIHLNFDPERDYGSHHYGNFEGLLDPFPWGYRYYTIGNLYQDNLNQDTSMQLPSYVVHPPTGYERSNMDRIIIRVREPHIGRQALQRIDQVYITQHNENQGTYDPAHTYQITTNLLRQIRQFSVGQNQQTLWELRNRFGSNADVSHIRSTWGHLACLGLLLFIVIQERYSFTQQNTRVQNRPNPWGVDEARTFNPIRNREPGSYNYTSEPQNDDQLFQCCLLCCFVLICILVCAILAFGKY